MTDIDWNTLVAALITIVSILIAWWQNKQKKDIITFFTDPVALPEPSNTAVLATVPTRSWKMSPETLKWVIFGESQEDQASLKGQILAAEAEGLTSYTIRYSKGYYQIEYGLIKASGREK
jgi:hypothetical protein